MFKKLLILLFLIGCSQETATTTISQTGFGFDIKAQDITVSVKDIDASDSDTAPEDAVQDSVTEDTDTTQIEDAETASEDVEQPPLPECIDNDGDGYGDNCDLGQDCDDSNPNFSNKAWSAVSRRKALSSAGMDR